VRRLRTRLTTLAQLARLVVIQDGDNVYIEEAVPVERPVRHCLGTVGFTDDHARPRARSCQRPICFDAAASVRGILLRRHLGELRKPFVELALVELPGDHEFHNGFFWLLYLRVELYDRLMIGLFSAAKRRKRKRFVWCHSRVLSRQYS
jgi:hypothetical protein